MNRSALSSEGRGGEEMKGGLSRGVVKKLALQGKERK